jgi:hypothetical protein
MDYLAVFSLPELVPPALAKKALEVAIRHYAALDKGPHLHIRDQQFVIYRAFLGSLGRLSLTQHIINAGHRSYLQFQKASQLPRSQTSTKGQQELLNVQINPHLK